MRFASWMTTLQLVQPPPSHPLASSWMQLLPLMSRCSRDHPRPFGHPFNLATWLLAIADDDILAEEWRHLL
jgi:hypothetical protein